MKYVTILLFVLAGMLYSQTGKDELVNPRDLIPDIVIDLRYNAADHYFINLPGGSLKLPKFYTANECLMTIDLVEALKVAQDSLRNIREHNGISYPEGIGIKIWDGYRPRAVQYLFWDIYPNPAYIANPNSGSMHNRGGAVDLTLIDMATGQELAMPTRFDDFSNRAGHNYTGLSETVLANRELLRSIMVDVAGLRLYSAEWWHYNVPAAGSYPLLDFQMK